jgi:arginine decarboxylase
VSAALKQKVNLETSSAFDIDLIEKLYEKGELKKDILIIHNGYKTDEYIMKILRLQEKGFKNSTIILDSPSEIDRIEKLLNGRKIDIGIRMAIDEEPQSSYYTSRLGIRSNELLDLYTKKIKGNKSFTMKMLHFFVDSGIKDTIYYLGEFNKAVKLYTKLKKICPTLDSLNLGGGFPIRNHLGFKYDYEYMINEIVRNIKETCTQEGVPDPNIFTEFGKYTVGEAGATIFKVIEQKQQNDQERWYIVDNSLMNTIPDAWSINEKFILLPINKWNNEYVKAFDDGLDIKRFTQVFTTPLRFTNTKISLVNRF